MKKPQEACAEVNQPLLTRRDLDLIFFSDNPKRVAKAKAICNICAIKTPCLSWALTLDDGHDEFTAGGLTQKERHAMMKEMAS